MTPFGRTAVALAACAIVGSLGAASAQTASPAASPAPAASAAPAASVAPDAQPARCAPREASLGGIGRVTVLTFTGPVFGGTVCAVVANVVADTFTAVLTDAPAADALVVAGLSGGGDVAVPLGELTLSGVGPYVIAPGGTIPGFGADTSEAPRIVLAYSGARVVLIATSAVALADLARILRAQPSLFGADAFERAVVIASGHGATLLLRTSDGAIGTPPTTPRALVLTKRG